MKKIIAILVLTLIMVSALGVPDQVEAKGTSYYKSAKSGRFTTKSYSNSHKATTYKSFRR